METLCLQTLPRVTKMAKGGGQSSGEIDVQRSGSQNQESQIGISIVGDRRQSLQRQPQLTPINIDENPRLNRSPPGAVE